jgi:hypothetical protein
MKRSQISIFLILGIAIVFLVGIFVMRVTSGDPNELSTGSGSSLSQADLTAYVRSCIRYSCQESMKDIGIRQEVLSEFSDSVEQNAEECVDAYMETLAERGIEHTKGEVQADVIIDPATITVKLNCPLTVISGDQRIVLETFDLVLDRTSYVKLDAGGNDEEMRLISMDGNAELIIPPGTIAYDKVGNAVESLSIKVEDLHFEGLENSVIVGQTVYENLPDGLEFSQPVKMAIGFNQDDIPSGYGRENLRIAYWDSGLGTWLALPSNVIGDRIEANITHFTIFGISFGKPHVIRNRLFEQRFSPFSASTAYAEMEEKEKSPIWLVGGMDFEAEGTVSLQEGREFNNNIQEGKSFTRWTDYKDLYEKDMGQFISYPLIQYGYFLTPDDPEEFIDCEVRNDDNPYGQVYDIIDGLPYFWTGGCPSYRCSLTEPCPIDGLDVCQGRSYCNQFSELTCLPYDEEKGRVLKTYEDLESAAGLMPCCLNRLEVPDTQDKSEMKFGWHNYQCVGGRVRPPEDGSSEVVDFIAFKPNGNSVISLEIFDLQLGLDTPIFVISKPLKIWPNIYPLKKLIKDARSGEFEAALEEVTDGIDSTQLNFYCNFHPFSDGQMLKSITLTDQQRSVVLSHYGIETDRKIPAWGIYGLDIIRRIDRPKDELHTQCDVIWAYWGQGDVTNLGSDGDIVRNHFTIPAD